MRCGRTRTGVADFDATVSQFIRRAWPGGKAGQPYDLQRSGKSRLRDLREPSLLQLRLRALFGVGARAEIVRILLTAPSGDFTVAQISEPIAYTRHQLATCESTGSPVLDVFTC